MDPKRLYSNGTDRFPEAKALGDFADSAVIGELNLKQSDFVRAYVLNDSTRGNGTECYALAYGYDFDDYDDVAPTDEEGNVLDKSEREKVYLTCAAAASRLLRNVKVQSEIQALYRSLLNPDHLDFKLSELVNHHDPKIRLAAVKDANQLTGRLVTKSQLVDGEGKALTNVVLNIVAPAGLPAVSEENAGVPNELDTSNAHVESLSSVPSGTEAKNEAETPTISIQKPV